VTVQTGTVASFVVNDQRY